jgi:hypothetical protein
MLYNLCLFQKVVFLAFKTLLSPFYTGERNFFVNLKVMISQMVRNKCARFGGHVDIEDSYKI